MDIIFSKKEINTFNDNILYYQENLLREIHKEYLSDKVDINTCLNEFKKKEKKPKIIIKKKVIKDEDRCCAKIWVDGHGSRCNKYRCKDIDYCKIHLYKRNYGRFDD